MTRFAAQGLALLRAATLAVIVGTTALVAMPAQAQGPGMAFGLFFGSGDDDDRDDFYPERAMCLTDYQIRKSVAAQGYSNIYLNVPNNKRIQVRATKGDWVYLLRFNYCTDRIESRERLRPAN